MMTSLQGSIILRWIFVVCLLVPVSGVSKQVSSKQVQSSYIGCYHDSISTRDMRAARTNNTGFTVDWCVDMCRSHSFAYAGLQSFACLCGNSYNGYHLASERECNEQCGGNKRQMCGDNYHISLYSVLACPLGYYGSFCNQPCHCKSGAACDQQSGLCPDGHCQPPWTGAQCNRNDYVSNQYIGCYMDNATRDLNGSQTQDRNLMTIHMCLEVCRNHSFSYAALQHSSSCFCDNQYGKYGFSENCSYPCVGDNSTICGGYWTNSIYTACPVGYYGSACDQVCHCTNQNPCSLTNGECPYGCDVGWTGSQCHQPVETPAIPQKGCYADEPSQQEALPELYSDAVAMSVTSCADNCMQQFGEYAGLQDGVKCMCGFYDYNMYGSSVGCDTNCPGNTSQNCGGYQTNNVVSVCPSGLFGALCARQCHCTCGCDVHDGSCSSCTAGWIGQACDIRDCLVNNGACNAKSEDCVIVPLDYRNSSNTGETIPRCLCKSGFSRTQADEECLSVTTDVSESTTITTTTTPAPTYPPSDITPDPFITLTLTATFTLNGTLTMECSEEYVDSFRVSYLDVVADINVLLDSNYMCTYTKGMRVIGGDIILHDVDYTVSIRFNTWMLPAVTQIMGDIEACSIEIKYYMENVSNWPYPIIPPIDDCPSNYMDPTSFEENAIEWALSQ